MPDTDAHARLRKKVAQAIWNEFCPGIRQTGRDTTLYTNVADRILALIAADEDARALVVEAALTEGRTQADIVAVGKAINKYLPPNIAIGDLGALAFDANAAINGRLREKIKVGLSALAPKDTGNG